jgi:potassium efflux system protein
VATIHRSYVDVQIQDQDDVGAGIRDDAGPCPGDVRTAMSRALAATFAFMLLFAPVRAAAEATTVATPADAATPAPTVTGTVTHVIASEDLQRATLTRLEQMGKWQELGKRATARAVEFEGLASSPAANAELIDVITLARQLRVLRGEVATILDELGFVARQLEHDRATLESDARMWRESWSLLDGQRVPGQILERARSTEAKLQGASARVSETRDNVLLVLDRTAELLTRIDDARARVATQEEHIRAQRLQLEQSPLWQLIATPAHFDLVAAELSTAWRQLGGYFSRNGIFLAGLFLGVLALAGWLFNRGAKHGAGRAQRAYGQPIAGSLLIALMALWWLAPDPPTLFYEALLLLLPIPAAMVARSALAAPISLTLFGVAVATTLIPIRGVFEASAIGNRLLLLLQAAAIAVPVAVDLYHGRLQKAFRWANAAVVRAAALLVLAVAAVTAIHVIFGFTRPAGSLRAGMGSILGFGLVFGASAVAVYGAVLALLATPALRWLRSARDADPSLLRAVRVVIGAFAVAGVVIVTLGIYGLVPTLLLTGQSLMDATLEVGTLSIAVRSVATALVVALATLVLAGTTGFVLDREVVPRLRLRPGTGYAIVTFTRWTIVIIGAALALAALGIDMAKVTLLAGALSVGIGFGLQNVVNNFVSGLILIVERPVGVGDVIERGTLSGTVTRIGIRSSTVRTGQGAEVIVPNGDLVSKEVVNWTRSDRRRRYDIDVGVAPGSDPEQVMRVLVEAAADVPEIMTDPAPRAMFKGFGDSSLNFTLLAWVPTLDVGLQAQNALRVAILRKLEVAGIAIPFPQRDVHIHSVDDHAGQMTN